MTAQQIPESIDPLRIPEIRTEIGRYLKKPALARSALVCREWNRTFTPLLYSVVEINKGEVINPSIKTLRRNKAFIKSMTVMTDNLDPLYSHLIMPNLKTLKLCIKFSSDNTEPMIQNHKNIRFLELPRMPSDDKTMFWKSVASLPHLEKLTIRNQDRCETDTMWDICGRVKKLNITNSFRQDLQASTEAVTSMRTADFHLLRDLTILRCGSYMTVQPMLIMKCQNLDRLEWRIGLDDIDSTDQTTLVQDFTQNLVSGKWPNIKSLAIGFDQVTDTAYAELTRALSNRALEKLDVSMTPFGELAFNALKYHFSTLRVLNIRSCPNLKSANVLEILASCPRLQSLTVDRIYARYLDPNQEWPCRKTLQSLSIEFELGQEPDHDESSGATSMEKTSEKLNETVFTCLGQLCELRHLSVSYRKPDKYYGRAYIRASVPLKIQLSKGLQKLVGLKRLNHFSVGVLAGSLGRGEIVWMLRNWPRLDVIEGFSKKKIPMKQVVKQKGITVI